MKKLLLLVLALIIFSGSILSLMSISSCVRTKFIDKPIYINVCKYSLIKPIEEKPIEDFFIDNIIVYGYLTWEEDGVVLDAIKIDSTDFINLRLNLRLLQSRIKVYYKFMQEYRKLYLRENKK